MGKILLLDQGSHFPLQQQSLDVQDEWKLADADAKVPEIMNHAQRDREPGSLYMSYLSAAGMDGFSFKPPSVVAEQVNKSIFNQVELLKPGLYLMDYPGDGLIRSIVARNPGC